MQHFFWNDQSTQDSQSLLISQMEKMSLKENTPIFVNKQPKQEGVELWAPKKMRNHEKLEKLAPQNQKAVKELEEEDPNSTKRWAERQAAFKRDFADEVRLHKFSFPLGSGTLFNGKPTVIAPFQPVAFLKVFLRRSTFTKRLCISAEGISDNPFHHDPSLITIGSYDGHGQENLVESTLNGEEKGNPHPKSCDVVLQDKTISNFQTQIKFRNLFKPKPSDSFYSFLLSCKKKRYFSRFDNKSGISHKVKVLIFEFLKETCVATCSDIGETSRTFVKLNKFQRFFVDEVPLNLVFEDKWRLACSGLLFYEKGVFLQGNKSGEIIGNPFFRIITMESIKNDQINVVCADQEIPVKKVIESQEFWIFTLQICSMDGLQSLSVNVIKKGSRDTQNPINNPKSVILSPNELGGLNVYLKLVMNIRKFRWYICDITDQMVPFAKKGVEGVFMSTWVQVTKERPVNLASGDVIRVGNEAIFKLMILSHLQKDIETF